MMTRASTTRPQRGVGPSGSQALAAALSQQIERVLAGQNRILTLLTTGCPLQECLEAVCRWLEELLDGGLCSVLLLEGNRLRLGAAPSLPEAYNQMIDGLEIGPRVGSCGAAAFSGRPVVAADIAVHPFWEPYREVVPRFGLRACWSVPIIEASSGSVLGTFAIYHRQPREPSEADLQLLEDASRLAGLAIRAHQVETERNQLIARERAARAEAEALASLIAAVAGSLDPARTLETAVTALPPLLGAHICAIALPDRNGVLTYQATNGVETELVRRYRFRPGEGLVGRAFQEQRLMRCDDLAVEPASVQRELDAALHARAFLAAPLVAHGRALGVIVAASQTPGSFSDHHAELLTTVAHHVAAALATAQLWEETRREAHQKAAILDQMSDAVLVLDASGAIVLANPAAAALYGVPREQLLRLTASNHPWQLFYEDGRPLRYEEKPLVSALRGLSTHHVLRIVRADGSERWGLVASSPLRDDHNRIQGAIAVTRDITEERQRQLQAAAGEKLRALGQMASGVAHDLNQYLSLIAGHGELALRTLEATGEPSGAVRDALNAIVDAALDGADTVKRLLAFARPASEHEATRLELGRLLEEVARLTAPRWRDAAQAEGRPIRFQLGSEGDTTIIGCNAALREVFTNLVLNAVDALPQGGTIRLAAERRGERVNVIVEDDGIGMPSEVQARAFEPFFSTKGERGTGLGLALVYNIVERHHGEIHLRSAPGRGTRFTISFPAAPVHGGRPVLAAAARGTARPGRRR